MRQTFLALFLWPEVNGHSYDVIPSLDPHNIYNLQHFGGKIQEMMKDMPEWKQKILRYFPPSPLEMYVDPRIEALHPDNDIQEVVRKAAEKFYGVKLEEEPKAQKFDDPPDPTQPAIAPPDTDAPPVKPVTAQNEDDEEDNMLWMAVGGIAVGAALVWIFSTKRGNPMSMDGGAIDTSAGYARMPEKRSPVGAMTDSESSGAERGSKSTESHSGTGPHSDIYSSIRRSLQDSDPSTVWKSVRASFMSSDTGSAAPHSDVRDKAPHASHAAESSVSHTDSEEEITEVYDRVKKSLKNLNLLPRKSQEMTKDMLPQGGPGGASGSSFR